jgi:hypothetical protein
VHVRTSSVARDLSKAKLERRLGAFEPSGSAQHAIARAEPEPPQRRAPDSERRGGIESLTGWIFVTQSGVATNASSVARDLSKVALEQRLGAFEAASTALPIARAEYRRGAMARDERTSQL